MNDAIQNRVNFEHEKKKKIVRFVNKSLLRANLIAGIISDFKMDVIKGL